MVLRRRFLSRLNIFFLYIFNYCSFFPLQNSETDLFLCALQLSLLSHYFHFILCLFILGKHFKWRTYYCFCFLQWTFCFPPPVRSSVLRLHTLVLFLFYLPHVHKLYTLVAKVTPFVLLKTTMTLPKLYFGFIVKKGTLPFLVFRIICSIFFIAPILGCFLFFFFFLFSPNQCQMLSLWLATIRSSL